MTLIECRGSMGVHPQTAYRWFRNGTMPVHAECVGPHTVFVRDAKPKGPVAGVGLCARVSSHDQESGLGRQVARLREWAAQNQIQVSKVLKEVGPGMNGQRKTPHVLVADPTLESIVGDHRGRLGWMNTRPDDGLVQDMGRALTVSCARLYGHRSARNRAKRAITHAQRGA